MGVASTTNRIDSVRLLVDQRKTLQKVNMNESEKTSKEFAQKTN